MHVKKFIVTFAIAITKRGVAQSGSAPGLGPGGRRFESCHPDSSNVIFGHGVWRSPVALLVRDQVVAGSNPVAPTQDVCQDSRCSLGFFVFNTSKKFIAEPFFKNIKSKIMMTIIALIIGVAVGFLIARMQQHVLKETYNNQLESQKQAFSEQTEELKKNADLKQNAINAAFEQRIEELRADNEKRMADLKRSEESKQAELGTAFEKRMQEQKDNAEQRLAEQNAANKAQTETIKKSFEQQLAESKASAEGQLNAQKNSYERQIANLKGQIESERSYAAKMREASERQWSEKLNALQQEVKKNTAEQLAAKQTALQESNRQQIDELLKPVKEQFADFKKSVDASRTQNELNQKDIQNTFETAMKLFTQEQQQAISSLKEQTQRIGSDAANLTKALKGDSKMQGDWGEMVLSTILENSGLRKNEEYFVQENTKDENGNNYRPDVIVRFPEGRSVVIDSKVSLKAYSDATATDDETERERLLKEHARSVRKHVDELAAKDYGRLVDDAIGFVLMFIPNETSYIAAMQQQPDLNRYAYQKHIIIISPSNLLMALQLAYNLWQYDRQNKNVEEIVRRAADLYDKVAGFEETFTVIGNYINKISDSYSKAKNQLYTGKGNVMGKVEALKQLGVTPKKQIKGIEE